MRLLPETLFGRDIDDVFAYPTSKNVRIRDARLGILKHLLTIGILLYVILEVLWDQGYAYELTTVSGTARFQLLQPTVQPGCTDPSSCSCDTADDPGCENDFTSVRAGSYCAQAAPPYNTSYDGEKLPCRFFESAGAGVTRNGAILVSTRVTTYEQVLNESNSDTCPILYTTTSKDEAYVNDIGRFTVLIDHSIVPDNLDLTNIGGKQSVPGQIDTSASSGDIKGALHVPKNHWLCKHHEGTEQVHGGKRKTDAPCYIKPNTTAANLDFFSLDVLMQAADSDLDALNPAKAGAHPQTYRQSGAIVLLNIVYSNYRDPGWTGKRKIEYFYWPVLVKGSTYKDVEPVYREYRTQRTLLDRHGIYISAIQGGGLHAFSSNNVIIQLTAAAAMLGAATVLTDLLALYVMPQKEHYTRYMFEDTEDFSDLRATGVQQDQSLATVQSDEPLSRPLIDGVELET